jgi:hypothetical protein
MLTGIKQASMALFPDVRRENWMGLFFLALLSGAYILFVILTLFLPDGLSELEEMKIFILGWIFAPLGAVLSVPLFVRSRQIHLAQNSNALAVLLFINVILFQCLTSGLNLIWQITLSISSVLFLSYVAVVAVPLINIIVFRRMKYSGFNVNVSYWTLLIVAGIGFANFLQLLPYFNYLTPLYVLVLSILVGLVAAFMKHPDLPAIQGRYIALGIDILVILLIVLACFDPAFTIDKHSQDFYLGPVNRILHGGTMLVDTFSQYGVLVIYFLALLVKTGLISLSYQGLSLAIALLMMLQFIVLYGLLIALTKNRYYAVFILMLTLLLNVFSSLGIVQSFPSTGPLRFGLAYLILATVLFRRHFPRFHTTGLLLEAGLIGLASVWSFETFVYTSFLYVGICLFDTLGRPVDIRKKLQSLAYRVIWMFIAILLFQSFFAFCTYVRSGSLPNWSVYFEFIRTYSVDTFGTILIEPWSPWIFPVAIYFVSFMTFVFRYLFLKEFDTSVESELAFGLTFFGIAQYTYFLARSHPNNLFLISIPAIMVAGYWFVLTVRNLPSLHAITRFVFYTSASLAVLIALPSFVSKLEHNTGYPMLFGNIGLLISGRELDLGGQSLAIEKAYRADVAPPVVEDAVDLVRKYMPAQEDAVVFLEPQYTTETLILAGRTNRFPISEPVEDTLSVSLTEHIVQYSHGLKTNDVIVMAGSTDVFQHPFPSYALQIRLLSRLCGEFSLKEVERQGDVIAVRLEPFSGDLSPYCLSIQRMESLVIK